MFQRRFDPGVSGQSLQRLQGHASLFERGEHLAALRIEIENFAGGIFVGQVIALFPALLFGRFGSLGNPGFPGILQILPDHLGSLRPPSTGPNRLSGLLALQELPKQLDKILTDRLNVLAPVL
ncbi:MAG TPA: hypothetical protein VGP68_23085 [Gemmataceae bacterium]|nr:hypothetical protein [Gemmataceae bacterium]